MTSNLDNRDIVTARLTQARAVIATTVQAIESGEKLPTETITAALWATDALLEQAQERATE